MDTTRILIACSVVIVIAIALFITFQGNPSAAPPLDTFGKAEWHFYAANYEEAATLYAQAIEDGVEEPKLKRAYFARAICLQNAEHDDEAIAAYEEAMQRYPVSREANHAEGEIQRIRLHRGE